MKTRLSIILLLIAGLTSAARAELWVDASAPGGGDGTADKPFQTINGALKKAIGGDTIIIRKGTYAEVVDLKLSGIPARPTTIRAVAGERVILSGFAPITDWKPEANGVYSATIEGRISNLYVGFAPQPVSRWPALDQPMRFVKNPDAKANSFQDPEALASQPLLKEIAASPKSAMAFLCAAPGNGYAAIPLASADASTFTLAPNKFFANIKTPTAHYELANHPSLIQKPGEWAFEKLSDAQSRVYFKPISPDDLKHTQYPQATVGVLAVTHGAHDIRLEGLEVCGSANYGIQIDHADHVTVSRCIIHDNATLGLWSRHSKNITFKDNIAVANLHGINMTSTHTGVIEGNEIAFNMADGINIAGNATGQPEGEPETSDITVKNNFIHHHLLRSYASNLDCYSGITNLKLQDNVMLFGMGGINAAVVKVASAKNCVIVGADAVLFDAAGHAQSTPPTGFKFKNAPLCETVSQSNDANSPGHLVLILNEKLADMAQYAKGDAVEVNGDGVLRHVTAVGKDSIDFEPALPVRPFRNSLVWNWKQATSLIPDYGFQEDGQGAKPVGVTLDIAAYQRGEFYDDGKRGIPVLPEDVKAALPNPNQPAVPLFGE
jgi:hypothetical protein